MTVTVLTDFPCMSWKLIKCLWRWNVVCYECVKKIIAPSFSEESFDRYVKLIRQFRELMYEKKWGDQLSLQEAKNFFYIKRLLNLKTKASLYVGKGKGKGKRRLWVLEHCCLEAYCTLTRMSSFIHLQRRCTKQAA